MDGNVVEHGSFLAGPRNNHPGEANTDGQRESSSGRSALQDAAPMPMPMPISRSRPRPRLSMLRNSARVILPIIFALHFVITGAVVMVYTVDQHKAIPPKFMTGAASVFGVIIGVWLLCHCCLCTRRRYWQGAEVVDDVEKSSTAGSMDTARAARRTSRIQTEGRAEKSFVVECSGGLGEFEKRGWRRCMEWRHNPGFGRLHRQQQGSSLALENLRLKEERDKAVRKMEQGLTANLPSRLEGTCQDAGTEGNAYDMLTKMCLAEEIQIEVPRQSADLGGHVEMLEGSPGLRYLRLSTVSRNNQGNTAPLSRDTRPKEPQLGRQMGGSGERLRTSHSKRSSKVHPDNRLPRHSLANSFSHLNGVRNVRFFFSPIGCGFAALERRNMFEKGVSRMQLSEWMMRDWLKYPAYKSLQALLLQLLDCGERGVATAELPSAKKYTHFRDIDGIDMSRKAEDERSHSPPVVKSDPHQSSSSTETKNHASAAAIPQESLHINYKSPASSSEASAKRLPHSTASLSETKTSLNAGLSDTPGLLTLVPANAGLPSGTFFNGDVASSQSEDSGYDGSIPLPEGANSYTQIHSDEGEESTSISNMERASNIPRPIIRRFSSRRPLQMDGVDDFLYNILSKDAKTTTYQPNGQPPTFKHRPRDFLESQISRNHQTPTKKPEKFFTDRLTKPGSQGLIGADLKPHQMDQEQVYTRNDVLSMQADLKYWSESEHLESETIIKLLEEEQKREAESRSSNFYKENCQPPLGQSVRQRPSQASNILSTIETSEEKDERGTNSLDGRTNRRLETDEEGAKSEESRTYSNVDSEIFLLPPLNFPGVISWSQDS